MLDATASIGLESRHEFGDAIAYSSCKGLFGLTGAAFIAYHEAPTVEVDSFYLSMESHIGKLMTGPYHAIASLDNVLADHDAFRESVAENKRIFVKRMERHLTRSREHQPLLCTHVRCKILTKDQRAILYAPRTDLGGSVVCHLGEAHLGRAARGKILSVLEIVE
jgi:2-aminoethylphosphonate-pyruvate transaminase